MGCGSSSDSHSASERQQAEGLKKGRNRRQELWVSLRKRLPTAIDLTSQVARDDLFDAFTMSGVKSSKSSKTTEPPRVISEDVALAGSLNILKLTDFFSADEVRPIVTQAFYAARLVNPQRGAMASEKAAGDAVVDRMEFRAFLAYIREYFELWAMFDEVDSSEDATIGFEEFEAAVPLIQDWGLKVADTRDAFKRMDVDGSHSISFVEFADWAIRHRLEYDGDDDDVAPSTVVADPQFRNLRRDVTERRKQSQEAYEAFLKKVGLPTPEVGKPGIFPSDISAAIARQNSLYQAFDVCDNEKISLEEFQKGLLEVLGLPALLPPATRHRNAVFHFINEVFHIGVAAMRSRGVGGLAIRKNIGAPFLNAFGFGYALLALHDLLELISLFDVVVDTDGSGGAGKGMVFITYDELKSGTELLQRWLNRKLDFGLPPSRRGSSAAAPVTNKNAARPVNPFASAAVRGTIVGTTAHLSPLFQDGARRAVPLVPDLIQWIVQHRTTPLKDAADDDGDGGATGEIVYRPPFDPDADSDAEEAAKEQTGGVISAD